MLPTSSSVDAFDSHFDLHVQDQKKRKLDRACDSCRRRKKRCDGPQTPNNCCSSCLQSERLCTYEQSSKPRGPPKAYVIGLENKKERLENLLERLYPGVDFTDELGQPVLRDSWKKEQPPSDRRPEAPLHLLPELRLPSSARMKHGRYRYRGLDVDECVDNDNSFSSGEDDDSSSDSEAMARSATLHQSTEPADFAEDPQTVRFHGKTSVQGLVVDATRKYRQMLLNRSGNLRARGLMEQTPSNLPLQCSQQRPEYWQAPKWELTWDGYRLNSKGSLVDLLALFPPLDLARSLVDLFFEYTNILLPFLHRPTFERQFKDKLYERDIGFVGICNVVFAIASRFSNDPRVVPLNAKLPNGDIDWCKAGWDYFAVSMYVHYARRSLFLPATLFEIQSYPLMSWFLRSTPAYAAAWPITGTGLRKAQDVGVHRKKTYREKTGVDGELWKRAFWLLVVLDNFSAQTLGRSSCINQEDYDLDLPLEVDDEYWETSNPTEAFKQPPGVPSEASAFRWFIKIGWIMNFTHKTLYAIDKSASFVPKTRNRAEQVLKDIETALDEWGRSLPEHIKWSENMQDPVFTSQAAMLYLLYRSAQIVVYRPFTGRPSDSSAAQKEEGHGESISTKALRMCMAAARSIVRVIRSQKTGRIAGTTVEFYSGYYAAGQLLLRIWDLKAQLKAQREKQDKTLSLLGNDAQKEDPMLSLTQEIDELIADVYIVVGLYEKHQARWEFVQPILERVKESLPKDGEMLPPDIWYQTTPKYFGPDADEEVTSQEPLPSVPNGPEDLSHLYGQPQSKLYPPSQTLQSTAVSNFPSISNQAPLRGKPSQSEAAREDSVSLGMAGPSTRAMTAPSSVSALQSYLENVPQISPFDIGQYFLPEEPQMHRQTDGGSLIHQTTMQRPVSYQTPVYNIFTPMQPFSPGYSFGSEELFSFMAEYQQAAGGNLAPAPSTFPENEFGLPVTHSQTYYHFERQANTVNLNHTAVPRSAGRFSDPAIQSALPRTVNFPAASRTERYSNPADYAAAARIPSQQLIWPSSEPNPFLTQSVSYDHFFNVTADTDNCA